METSKAQQIVIVKDKHVSCAGQEGELGHPKVFLQIAADNKITCPYCSKEFIYQPPS